MSEPTEDPAQILEEAFAQAFSPPSSRRHSAVNPIVKEQAVEESAFLVPAQVPAAEPVLETPEPSSSSSEEDIWKQEYEEQVKTWRAQSAEVREKAEKVREQWESKRAAEREEAAKRKAAGIPEPELEVIPGPPTTAPSVSSSTVLVPPHQEEPVHLREQVGGKNRAVDSPNPAEIQERTSRELPVHAASSTISQPDTVDGSQKWEEVNSASTSSYPSMSFPEQATPPLEHQRSHHHHPRHEPAPAPPTATLSVFDSSLSTRTRLKALASSVAINLFLPFVNGVMLGFGEIFAKNFVLGWLGWGSTATTVGISQRSRFAARR